MALGWRPAEGRERFLMMLAGAAGPLQYRSTRSLHVGTSGGPASEAR